jgi:hypothetical protein
MKLHVITNDYSEGPKTHVFIQPGLAALAARNPDNDESLLTFLEGQLADVRDILQKALRTSSHMTDAEDTALRNTIATCPADFFNQAEALIMGKLGYGSGETKFGSWEWNSYEVPHFAGALQWVRTMVERIALGALSQTETRAFLATGRAILRAADPQPFIVDRPFDSVDQAAAYCELQDDPREAAFNIAKHNIDQDEILFSVELLRKFA